MKRICLAMIVKDEAPVIGRCLASVRPYISSWVVCDTGSTDDTPALVEAALAGIPGELHRDAWVDFGHNRTLAVRRALERDAEYVLTIDADEVLHLDDPAALDDLTLDEYGAWCRDDAQAWPTPRLLRSALPWRWEDVIHEYPDCGAEYTRGMLAGVRIVTPHDGARAHDPERLARDVRVLRGAVAAHPGHPRYRFYLGMTLERAGDVAGAIAALEHRCTMEGGFEPERWYARYQLGHLYAAAGRADEALSAYVDAYAGYPLAAEPLYWVGRFYLAEGDNAAALPYLELAARKPKPEDLLFREEAIYDRDARLYLALCLVRLGRAAEANAILLQLGLEGGIPEDALEQAERALGFGAPRAEVA